MDKTSFFIKQLVSRADFNALTGGVFKLRVAGDKLEICQVLLWENHDKTLLNEAQFRDYTCVYTHTMNNRASKAQRAVCA